MSAAEPEIPEPIRTGNVDGIRALLAGISQTSRLVAKRGDWLFLEAQSLAVLYGVGRLASPSALPAGLASEDTAGAWCREYGLPGQLGDLLRPTSLRARADANVAIALAAQDANTPNWHCLRQILDDPECVTLQRARVEPERRQQVLSRCVSLLASVTGVVGILLTGSAADESKVDGWSDLDVQCLCREIPSAEARDSLLDSLGATNRFRHGICDFVVVDDVKVEVKFVTMSAQEAALQQLAETGEDPPLLDFEDPRQQLVWSVYAYDWAHGRILADTDGRLLALAGRVNDCHAVHAAAVRRRWEAVRTVAWERAATAAEVGDRCATLAAVHHLTDAALRLFLAARDCWTNPHFCKWFPHELVALGRRDPDLAGVVAPFSVGPGEGLDARPALLEALGTWPRC